jgi:hypothetical protein
MYNTNIIEKEGGVKVIGMVRTDAVETNEEILPNQIDAEMTKCEEELSRIADEMALRHNLINTEHQRLAKPVTDRLTALQASKQDYREEVGEEKAVKDFNLSDDIKTVEDFAQASAEAVT